MTDAPFDQAFPRHWVADAVIGDGSAVHIRPISTDDDGLLREFHSKLSEQTIYYRYFTPYPELLERDVQRLVTTDFRDRVALVATVGGRIVGVGRFDRVSSTDAEVAFTVRDDYQGRGLGSVLLEHIAAAARERGIRRFVAEVLPQNRRMTNTFDRAGYIVAQELDDGVVKLAFEIEPTARLREVTARREHAAELRSVGRILNPAAVAVVGPSGPGDEVEQRLVRQLRDGGFTGRIYPVRPGAAMIAGLPVFPDMQHLPGPADLAVIAVPVDDVGGVVAQCGEAGVHAVIVLGSGFADAGAAGVDRERELVAAVRGNGMRLVGPNSLGVINTDPRTSLHAALVRRTPPRGRVGVYTQSPALSLAALDGLAARRLGVSSFVATGNRADITGHEVLHHFSADDMTSVVLMSVESIANPSKFIRIAAEVGQRKPVVVLRSGRTSQAFPLGTRPRRTELPPAGVEQLLEDSGIVQTDSLDQLLDVGSVLACQPLPRGARVTVIGDTVELVNLTADVCATSGLEVADQVALPVASFARWLPDALAAAVRGSGTDAVIVVHVPAVQIDDDGVSEVLLAASADARVPLLAVLHRGDGRSSLVTDPGRDAHHGSVPVFTTVESAVRALTLIVGHARWRSREPGRVPDLPDIDQETARSLVAARLRGRDSAESGTTVPLVGSQLQEMLACYGIDLLESIPVSSEDEAVAAADQTGWPVVLKTLDPRLVRRGEHEGIRLNIESEAALRAAYLSMAATLDDSARSRLEVQPMAPPGVAVTVRVLHDPLFGPTVSCGMAGLVPELLGDRAHTVPPVTDADAARLVRGPGASSILLGYGGREPLDVRRLEDLIVRAGLLAHQIPQLQRLDLDPVIVGVNGLAVAGATAWVQPAQPRSDSLVRRLTDI